MATSNNTSMVLRVSQAMQVMPVLPSKDLMQAAAIAVTWP